MKTMTINDIIELEQLKTAKLDRIAALERMIVRVRNSYRNMTTPQLEEAIRDVVGTRNEIKAEQAWCDQADAKIAAFFAPASK